MSSQLSSVPIERRRQAAAACGLLTALLLAVGIVPWVADAPGSIRALSTMALVAAGAAGLVAWGLVASIRADVAERRVDAAIAEVVTEAAATGALTGFDCGHDHDPDEMTVCPSVGTCTHDCATCLRG